MSAATTVEPEIQPTEPTPKLTDEQRIQNWLDKKRFDFTVAHSSFTPVYGDRWRIDLYKNRAEVQDFSRNLIIEKSFFLRVSKDQVEDLTIKSNEVQPV